MILAHRGLWLPGVVLALVALGNVAANTDLASPPRYDGAGYAVLARALGAGRGYREIDHPEAPRHAHFPPGYPIALAALWGATGSMSFPAAHAASIAATVGAVLLCWRWFGTLYEPRAAWLLGLALACNWRWGRDGGVIRSEPLFLLLSAAGMLISARVARRGGLGRAVGLGVVLGAATLTRHVGVALVGAIGLDLWLRGRRREALAAVLVPGALLASWAAWVARVGRGTQAELLPGPGGLGRLIVEQALFYLRRIPDQITGPVVEVGTVFRPALAGPMTLWAALATLVVVAGWRICLRRHRHRPAALVPLATLGILLVWPFTEAGRFLVPLIPFLLVGSVEGLAWAGARLGRPGARRHRHWLSAVLVALSLPYSIYAIWSDRAGAERTTHAPFDAACAWISSQTTPPGPILTRHPGEAFLQTGRQALSVENGSIDAFFRRRPVAFFLDDGARYANAPADPLAAWAEAHPERLALVRGEPGGVAVYRVLPPAPAPRRAGVEPGNGD